MRFVPLGGFLGAGKTTTMLAAARLLEAAGEKVSLVTNDQGADLVDTTLAATVVDEVDEITGGCFCCRFDDLAAVITRLDAEVQPTVVLAEAVGSCTDLQSTVVRPLRHFYGERLQVAPLTVVVDPLRYVGVSIAWFELATEPDLAYLYRHQLDEADVIAVNKTDLLTPVQLDEVRADIGERCPHARVVTFSARTGDGLDELLAAWEQPATEHVPFDVDYDRYGAAEAELTWTNQTLRLRAAGDEGFVPAAWTERFLREFSRVAVVDDVVVGHVKVWVGTPDGATKASLTEAGGPPSFDERHAVASAEAGVVLNARVRTSPDDLDELIARCVASADEATGAVSADREGDVFRPGYPVPVHRM